MNFYVYADWTLEETPRCFYIGIGNKSRFEHLKRNKKHTGVANKYGQNRLLIAQTEIRGEAEILEQQYIQIYKTLAKPGEIGCNFTTGGEKRKEITDEVRANISEATKAALAVPTERILKGKVKQKIAMARFDIREKISEGCKAKYQDKNYALKMKAITTTVMRKSAIREKISERTIEALKDKTIKEKMIIGIHERWQRIGEREKTRIATKAAMARPDVREKIQLARNTPEAKEKFRLACIAREQRKKLKKIQQQQNVQNNS